MSTEIIRPSGAGSSTQLTPSAGSNYACVDEATKNESDYVQTSYTVDYKKDLYAFGNPAGISAGDVINSVTVNAYIASTNGSYNIMAKLCCNSAEGSEIVTRSTSYVLRSKTWTTNGGVAWTLADLNSLEAGIAMMSSGVAAYARCCQVWVEIDYTSVSGNRVQIIGLW